MHSQKQQQVSAITLLDNPYTVNSIDQWRAQRGVNNAQHIDAPTPMSVRGCLCDGVPGKAQYQRSSSALPSFLKYGVMYGIKPW